MIGSSDILISEINFSVSVDDNQNYKDANQILVHLLAEGYLIVEFKKNLIKY